MSDFNEEVKKRIKLQTIESDLAKKAHSFLAASLVPKYSYNFSWQGRPIIQYPQDIVAMQEIIWTIRPDLIIETGIAHGGSLIFSASMLAQLDMCDAIKLGHPFDPKVSHRKVLGVDIDIRQHNKDAIEAHPMASRIEMIEGSSIDLEIINRVKNIATNYKTILVCLDSNHTHDHVLAELEAYAKLTSIGSYCVVFDTLIEDVSSEIFPDRPWGPGNNPKTAVWEYLKNHPEFSINNNIDKKLLISVSPEGYLKRIK